MLDTAVITSPRCARVRCAPLSEVRHLEVWQRGREGQVRDHRYYEVVADTLGFEHWALVVEDDDGIAIAVQPCFFVEQDLLVAAPAPLQAIAGIVRKIFPCFLRLKMLMAGCAAGEGHLDTACATQPAWLPQLHAMLLRLAREQHARLVVWKDFPAGHRGAMSALKATSPTVPCTHIASMPATRLALDFTSFDDYLARRLSHATRKNLRRKFKALAAAPPITMSVTQDLGDDVDAALALYEQVRSRSPLQFERLTKAFLQQLAARLPDRAHFFLWRQEGRLVAFSLCLVHDGTLYDEYLGLDYRVALDLHLYFVTFRDLLTWALANGLSAYSSTPLSYAPKRQLGFDLVPLDLYFALPQPWLNRLAKPLLTRMSPTRAEPVLQRFRNAAEMRPTEAPRD